MRGHSPHRQAFSLIELLVVIGIIAILLGILLPTITRVRLHAQQLQCMAKLRQVGYAFAMYANANQGHYPPYNNWEVYGNPGTGEDDDDQFGWCERVEQYLGKPETGIYWCPSFPPETQFNYFMGAHWNALHQRDCLLVTDVKRSSEFVLGGECTHQRLYPPPWGEAATKFSTQDCDKDDVRWKCLSFFGEEYGFNAHPAGQQRPLRRRPRRAVQALRPGLHDVRPAESGRGLGRRRRAPAAPMSGFFCPLRPPGRHFLVRRATCAGPARNKSCLRSN